MTSIEHPCQYPTIFTPSRFRSGELRVMVVVAMTALTMVAEIAAGLLFGSIALLADGLHMASHTVALAINLYAYVYARRHAGNREFSFGTGKVNALGGFTGAVLLAVFALMMAWESIERLVSPVAIAFNQAIPVAVFGLVINGLSAFILNERHDHEHRHEHGHEHHHDHNLRAAYLHVLADALTSLLAIAALLAGKYLGLVWLDPFIGLLGAALVSRWSLGLLRVTASVLLDKQEPHQLHQVRSLLEKETGATVTDLHVWEIGPQQHSVVVSIETATPQAPTYYKHLLCARKEFVHVIVEVNPRLLPRPDREQR
ncbi:MAG: CDF family Co(II)/Ni(II) efflux transporter DmeF [Caldilineales bacterium]|nr:CDF family Co(II)/Ni(II) efflux transporter DmeF [Caldilineales bacterium]